MNIGLITAGGIGNRMGQDIPKQFMCIDNKPIIIYTLQAFQAHPEIDAIAVICLSGWEIVLQAYANQYNITKLKWIFNGADSNQMSIYNGITGLKSVGCNDDDIILVHDGVRPLVSHEIITNNIITCKQYGYAVTGLTCKEAIMKLDNKNKVNLLDIPREKLIRTQTPHTYRLYTLLEAHKLAIKNNILDTVATCTLIPLTSNIEQHLVLGTEKNGLKLTCPQDIELFKALIHTNPEPWLK